MDWKCIPNSEDIYLIPIPTVMTVWVEHGMLVVLYPKRMHAYLTIVVDEIDKCLRQKCVCDNYFGQVWRLMWTSLTIVSDRFVNDYFVPVCLTIKFCVIQFCPLWNSLHNYLLVVNYFSHFPEVVKLTKHDEEHVSWSDNGPSTEFMFSWINSYGLQHITSSPMFLESNGQGEGWVQTIKKKSKVPYIALRHYQSTHLSWCDLSCVCGDLGHPCLWQTKSETSTPNTHKYRSLDHIRGWP